MFDRSKNATNNKSPCACSILGCDARHLCTSRYVLVRLDFMIFQFPTFSKSLQNGLGWSHDHPKPSKQIENVRFHMFFHVCVSPFVIELVIELAIELPMWYGRLGWWAWFKMLLGLGSQIYTNSAS